MVSAIATARSGSRRSNTTADPASVPAESSCRASGTGTAARARAASAGCVPKNSCTSARVAPSAMLTVRPSRAKRLRVSRAWLRWRCPPAPRGPPGTARPGRRLPGRPAPCCAACTSAVRGDERRTPANNPWSSTTGSIRCSIQAGCTRTAGSESPVRRKVTSGVMTWATAVSSAAASNSLRLTTPASRPGRSTTYRWRATREASARTRPIASAAVSSGINVNRRDSMSAPAVRSRNRSRRSRFSRCFPGNDRSTLLRSVIRTGLVRDNSGMSRDQAGSGGTDLQRPLHIV